MSETKVDETKPTEPKPKKVAWKSLAIAVGIICILLVAVLGSSQAEKASVPKRRLAYALKQKVKVN